MQRLKAFIRSPWPYSAWALLVLIVLVASYFSDPYVLAFSTFIFGGATLGVALVGLPVALLAGATAGPARAAILISVGVAGAAVATALAILRTFNWP